LAEKIEGRSHGLGVSLGVYAISDLHQKIEAVTKLEAEITGSKALHSWLSELPVTGNLKN